MLRLKLIDTPTELGAKDGVTLQAFSHTKATVKSFDLPLTFIGNVEAGFMIRDAGTIVAILGRKL